MAGLRPDDPVSVRLVDASWSLVLSQLSSWSASVYASSGSTLIPTTTTGLATSPTKAAGSTRRASWCCSARATADRRCTCSWGRSSTLSYGVFRVFGVSILSSRLISAASGSLLLLAFWLGMRRVASAPILLLTMTMLTFTEDLVVLSRVATPRWRSWPRIC